MDNACLFANTWCRKEHEQRTLGTLLEGRTDNSFQTGCSHQAERAQKSSVLLMAGDPTVEMREFQMPIYDSSQRCRRQTWFSRAFATRDSQTGETYHKNSSDGITSRRLTGLSEEAEL